MSEQAGLRDVKLVTAGGMRGPVAELVELIRDYGFPLPSDPKYAEAIDQACTLLLKKIGEQPIVSVTFGTYSEGRIYSTGPNVEGAV